MSGLLASRRPTCTSSNSGNAKRWARELLLLSNEATVMVTDAGQVASGRSGYRG
jgi:hypothetical protein